MLRFYRFLYLNQSEVSLGTFGQGHLVQSTAWQQHHGISHLGVKNVIWQCTFCLVKKIILVTLIISDQSVVFFFVFFSRQVNELLTVICYMTAFMFLQYLRSVSLKGLHWHCWVNLLVILISTVCEERINAKWGGLRFSECRDFCRKKQYWIMQSCTNTDFVLETLSGFNHSLWPITAGCLKSLLKLNMAKLMRFNNSPKVSVIQNTLFFQLIPCRSKP